MNGHGERLSRKQELAIAALLELPTLEGEANVVGVSQRTIRNWLNLPRFTEAYREARRQIVEASIGRLQQATGEAVQTLRRNINCAQASVEVKAALGILDQWIKCVELMDLEQAVIEERLGQPVKPLEIEALTDTTVGLLKLIGGP